ncbi:hypothetical protein CLOSTHATH_06943, partial [Hungatella hathewayi DSM 13479]
MYFVAHPPRGGGYPSPPPPFKNELHFSRRSSRLHMIKKAHKEIPL